MLDRVERRPTPGVPDPDAGIPVRGMPRPRGPEPRMVLFRRTADSPAPDNDARLQGAGPAGSSDAEDAQTVARLARGDLGALAELYDRFGAAVFALARHIGGDAAAEDVTRDVLLAARRDAHRFDPTRGSVTTWLLTTTRHRAVAARRGAPATGRPTDGAGPGRSADLSPEQQRLVELTYVEGYTTPEIARIVGWSADAVLVELTEAMARLRPAP